jgi:hypothetical protein
VKFFYISIKRCLVVVISNCTITEIENLIPQKNIEFNLKLGVGVHVSSVNIS